MSGSWRGIEVRGNILRDTPLAGYTWFRVGGPADVVFAPADEADLIAYLGALPRDVPVTPVGVGSNLLVRDGGIRGVTVRLGRKFASIETLSGFRIRVGAFALAARCAEAAAEAGIGGLAYLRGIPGTIGGVLAMNAGCYGTDTSAVLERAVAVDREGRRLEFDSASMGFSYRHCRAAKHRIFVEAVFRGYPAATQSIRTKMNELVRRREASQPVRERTGGSTFRNPGGGPGAGSNGGRVEDSAWRLIEAAGCRGLRKGGAAVSEQHANFLVNRKHASAADLEALGEEIRRRVRASSGVELSWEIRLIGEHPESEMQEGRKSA